MDLRNEVVAKLSALGHTPEIIALNLRGQGIKGSRNDGYTCPIAKAIGANVLVDYGYHTCDLIAVPKNYQGVEGVVRVPNPVVKFIHRFDNGEFPDLRGE